MPNREIYKIRITKCDVPAYWYSDYINTEHYAVHHSRDGIPYYRIINNPDLNGCVVKVRNVIVLELITQVRI